MAVRTPYIRVVGLQVDQHNNGRGKPVFTDAEEEEYIRMARQPNLYETFASSIAPSIFGNAGKIFTSLFSKYFNTLIHTAC